MENTLDYIKRTTDEMLGVPKEESRESTKCTPCGKVGTKRQIDEHDCSYAHGE